MDVLTSRVLLYPTDPPRSRRFYGETLGLAVAREYGPAEAPGVVFHCGQSLVEINGHAGTPPGESVALWLQVRDVAAEHARLRAAGVSVLRAPRTEPWGLVECWIADPDGTRIVLVEIPTEHPLRRDIR